METAVLDACILFQGKLTNFLLHLAEQSAFDPVWSPAIHDEWTRNLLRVMGIPPEKLAYRRRMMEEAFPAADCPPLPELVNAIEATCRTDGQRKDAHVIATAITAQASVIVTENAVDFPDDILSRHGLRIATPDDFCAELYRRDPSSVLIGARAHRASLQRPAYDQEHYLAFLADRKFGMIQTASLLWPHRNEL